MILNYYFFGAVFRIFMVYPLLMHVEKMLLVHLFIYREAP